MNEFGGRTINGEVSRYTERKKQADPQALLDALDALLDTPGVEAVRWNQYTPYFNDGEPCEFNVYDAYVKIAGDEEEAGDYADGYRNSYELWDFENGWGSAKVFHNIAGADGKAIHAALEAFEKELQGERHDVVLNEKFGDPAQVTATKAGFDVEFYEHD